MSSSGMRVIVAGICAKFNSDEVWRGSGGGPRAGCRRAARRRAINFHVPTMDGMTFDDVPGRRPDPPAPPLLRTLWVMTGPPNRSVTAAIFDSRNGHELRVS